MRGISNGYNMKKLTLCALCALSLVACTRHTFSVSPEYKAITFFSIDYRSVTDAPAVPSAEGYFEDLEKKLNNNIFFSQVFSGTDRDSETGAYMQADFQAALYAEQNRKTANEKYEEIIKEINTKDIGAGNFKCTFVYSFERNIAMDHFEKEIEYSGGFRYKSEEAKINLAGTSTNYNIDFSAIDPQYTINFYGEPKICMPDNRFVDKSEFGDFFKLNDIRLDEDKACFVINFTITLDEAQMAKMKSNVGNWHVLAPATVSGEGNDTFNFYIYIPLNIQ